MKELLRKPSVWIIAGGVAGALYIYLFGVMGPNQCLPFEKCQQEYTETVIPGVLR